MGNNLSSTFIPDTSKDVLSPTDRTADIILGVTWLLVIYAMVMIWTTCALVDRWKGPQDRIRVGGGRVMMALVMSAAWPAVVVYLAMAKS
ncbi:hypothetical protein TsFJ059_003170 [Trichoderma semiorbis]|uniref:Uncharacterized protein n=5 Tax=Trichoderma TaxID=5543 RepID=A0A2T4APX0_TRIHA|nr:hypothetical protein M431DRAFT_75433 [Trichoderma harzianum CBS 226.95]KAF3075188.1 hypothetical protein CFAM422_002559 [Trichoderma lentiforme]KAH0528287.1 hypothetical protein TsFJ059_003170 [Trichoderma semiorbis]KAK0765887.1 hypothetical protein N5P37_001827 [Trichoderma harzianum]QYS98577.1 hypothetical protein H0G86_005754 [Trichoderma simmonsii]KKP00604.1 hypothetical protein THAR02_07291 [Trichoderma harzianum]